MGTPLPEAIAVTINDACRITGLGRSKMYDEINAGRLPIRKAGQRTLIRIVDLQAFIDALPEGRRYAP
ncbi:helix-turn-helix domain-containing protein [Hyphomonas sp.]|uniref:helix-turn-helix domain-containing protein n=1 Tax=Hyphomonas sp. TaxID=87 RepID=UPI003F70CC82